MLALQLLTSAALTLAAHRSDSARLLSFWIASIAATGVPTVRP